MKTAMQWQLAMLDPDTGWYGAGGDLSLCDIIRAIQADALESAEKAIVESNNERRVESHGLGYCVGAIRALKPTVGT